MTAPTDLVHVRTLTIEARRAGAATLEVSGRLVDERPQGPGVGWFGSVNGSVIHDMRASGTWDESRQSVTETICPYCGVGCGLELHVQDNRIVKVTSPLDSSVTGGHLCIKSRFGFEFVQNREG